MDLNLFRRFRSSAIPGAPADPVEFEDERGLRETVERLRATLEASGAGTFRWNIATNIIDCDRNINRLLGLDLGATACPLDELLVRVHPDDRQRVRNACERCARQDTKLHEEFRIVRPDESTCRLLWQGRIADAADGAAPCLTGVCVDITGRRQPESDRRNRQTQSLESEARLRALVQDSPLGIVMMDLAGHPILYNPKSVEMHGIALPAASGTGWIQALHPDDRERVVASWHEAVSQGRPWSQTYRFLHGDGGIVWVSGRAAPMYVEGEQVGFVGMLEDITALKNAEAERDRLLELEQQARRQAEDAIRARDEMMSIVAHDLRNPLHIFNIVLNRMRRKPSVDPEEAAREFSLLDRTAKSMEMLIRDLLDVSRIESGTFAVEKIEVQVPGLLGDVLELFDTPARESGLALSCDVEPEATVVIGDRARLTQVLWNLVENALKYTPRDGRVMLRARRHEGFVQISVEDTGKGISADHLPHIFNRFWQVNRTSGVGAGLGLAIAKGIIEAHGGRIWVESTEGRGTCFHFTLPAGNA